MNYGYFDDDRREYVITNPCTPVKWINYIGTLAFGGYVDHTGGALICKGDPALNRIVRYIPQSPASDFKGETLYIRVPGDPDRWQIFSPFYTPAQIELDHYECRIGLGYSRFLSESHGLRVEVTVFIPIGEDVEIRQVRVENYSNRALSVDVVPVVEYTHPDALKQFTNADWVPQTMQSKTVNDEDGFITLLQYPFYRRDTAVNYFTSNVPASSWETDRRTFLGKNEYGSWGDPAALQEVELGNGQALRGDNIAALMHHLGELQPGDRRTIITLLGQAESIDAASTRIQKYRNQEVVKEALEQLSAHWNEFLSAMQVQLPDEYMQCMLNTHNPRQCYITLNWSRYLSSYQLGFGARGIGFRDSCQDVMGVLANAPDEAAALLRKLLSVQKRDGSAMHQFNPQNMIATAGDAGDVEDAPRYYSDDHLWSVLAVCAFLKETGDLSFLEETIPFYEKDSKEQPVEAASVLEHLHRAIRFTQGDLGRNGLPLLGFADWNDTVNLARGAESFFTACLYGKALLELEALARILGVLEEADEWRAAHQSMKETFNACGWDGRWYIRYLDANGAPIGSKKNKHGQIYLNAQSWAVIAGFAPPERARIALESAHERLNTKYGIKLSAPGYDGYDPSLGGVSTYPPGAKENGGIFVHANPWAIIAHCLLGDGDRAWLYYCQINPAAQNDRIDEYECEPYVYSQNILGDEHPQFGLARNSWLTGASSWAYQAATQYILGIRAEYGGLRIDPCIPPSWGGFQAVRRFRGSEYQIEVENPTGVSCGVRELMVDGERVMGNLVSISSPGGRHLVSVVLG